MRLLKFFKKYSSHTLLALGFLLLAQYADAQTVQFTVNDKSNETVQVGKLLTFRATGLSQNESNLSIDFRCLSAQCSGKNANRTFLPEDYKSGGVWTYSITAGSDFIGEWSAQLRRGTSLLGERIFYTIAPTSAQCSTSVKVEPSTIVWGGSKPTSYVKVSFNYTSTGEVSTYTRNIRFYKKQSDGTYKLTDQRQVTNGQFLEFYPGRDFDETAIGQWQAEGVFIASTGSVVTSCKANRTSYSITDSKGNTGGVGSASPTPKDPNSSSTDECQKCIDDTKADCSPPDSDFCSDEAILNTTCASKCGGSDGLPTEGAAENSSTAGDGDEFSGIDLDIEGVYKIIVGIACWLMRVAVALIVIFLIYSGFKFLVAQGEAAKVTDARKNLQSVIIGIVVIVGVYVIIGSIATAIGVGGSYSFFTCSETTSP